MKNKVENGNFCSFPIFHAIWHIFSIYSFIFKFATAVNDHNINTGHLIFFVLPLWKNIKIVDGCGQSFFKLKLENNTENRKNALFNPIFHYSRMDWKIKKCQYLTLQVILFIPKGANNQRFWKFIYHNLFRPF